MTLDVPLLRSDTPGVANVLHFVDVVDSDASGQLDLAALERAIGLCRRLLRRPASQSGRLCHGDGGDEWGARRRRALMLPILLSTIISL